MAFQPVDRLPMWEWAMWWDKTLARWRSEGLPDRPGDDVFAIHEYFGLDPYKQFWFSTIDPTVESVQHQVEGSVSDMDDYRRICAHLFPDHRAALDQLAPWFRRQAEGDAVVWTTLEGFFWFPRTLMGFSKLMLAYYDQPELIHRINQDLLDYNLRLLDQIGGIGRPTFVTVAEDMSYNNGPMISREICDRFLSPYYRRMLERISEMNALTFVDTDGDVTRLIPWMESLGIHGVLPLERQAGVDGMNLRRSFPTLRMIGHFDKMVMPRGESAMRAEFDRLTPLVRSGGFIPSVDHQTPPGVSLEQYRVYLHLLEEYAHAWASAAAGANRSADA
jgi:Uroporphyrinogen decarboxylase (URO-D)